MDGAGFAVGIACGMGCGIASGIASGRSSGQEEMANRIRAFAVSEGLTVTMRDGQAFPLEDLLAAGKDTTPTSRRGLLILLAVTGLLVVLTIAAWIFFAMRN